MKKLQLLFLIFVLAISCTSNDKNSPEALIIDSTNLAGTDTMTASGKKHVNWEMGDQNNVNKILKLYQLWDEKKPYEPSDYFADTLRLNIPEVRKELVLPAKEIYKKIAENRELYQFTSNDIISSVALHDKNTGEDWVMVTAYSKWIEKDGTKDSVLYHDDWRFKNGKIDLLLSFHKLPPKGFKANTEID